MSQLLFRSFLSSGLMLALTITPTYAGGLFGCPCNRGAAAAYHQGWHGHADCTACTNETAEVEIDDECAGPGCPNCPDKCTKCGKGIHLPSVHALLAHKMRIDESGSLLMDLRHCEAKVRAAAADKLGKYSLAEHPEIEPALAKALVNDCDKHVRLAAVHSLKELRACSHISIEAFAHAKMDECLLVKLAACKAANLCAKSRSTCPSCHHGCGQGCGSGQCYNDAAYLPPSSGEQEVIIEDIGPSGPAMRGQYIPQGHKRYPVNTTPEPPRQAEPYVIGQEQYEPRIGDVRSVPRRYELPDGQMQGNRETLPVLPPRNELGYYVIPRTR